MNAFVTLHIKKMHVSYIKFLSAVLIQIIFVTRSSLPK